MILALKQTQTLGVNEPLFVTECRCTLSYLFLKKIHAGYHSYYIIYSPRKIFRNFLVHVFRDHKVVIHIKKNLIRTAFRSQWDTATATDFGYDFMG